MKKNPPKRYLFISILIQKRCLVLLKLTREGINEKEKCC